MVTVKRNVSICWLIIIFIIFYIVSLFEKFEWILLLLNYIIAIKIIFKSKLSYFSIQAVVMNYALLPIFSQKYFGISYGLLQQVAIPIYFKEISYCVFFYNISLYYFAFFTDFLKYESINTKKSIYVPKVMIYLLAICAMIFIVIAFPRIPFTFQESKRFNALLLGKAWHILAEILLIICMFSETNYKIINISFAFVVFWSLSHFERVDILGLIILYCYFQLKRSNRKVSLNKLLKIGSSLLGVVVICILIGSVRVGKKISIGKILFRIFVSSTCSDIMYIFNTGIHYTKLYDFIWGITYKQYIDELKLFFDSTSGITEFLKHFLFNMGGGYILTEPYVNFGYIGVILYALLQNLIIFLLIRNGRDYCLLVYAMWIDLVFRTSYYGLYYFEKPMIMYIPFCLAIVQISKKFLVRKIYKLKYDKKYL